MPNGTVRLQLEPFTEVSYTSLVYVRFYAHGRHLSQGESNERKQGEIGQERRDGAASVAVHKGPESVA